MAPFRSISTDQVSHSLSKHFIQSFFPVQKNAAHTSVPCFFDISRVVTGDQINNAALQKHLIRAPTVEIRTTVRQRQEHMMSHSRMYVCMCGRGVKVLGDRVEAESKGENIDCASKFIMSVSLSPWLLASRKLLKSLAIVRPILLLWVCLLSIINRTQRRRGVIRPHQFHSTPSPFSSGILDAFGHWAYRREFPSPLSCGSY